MNSMSRENALEAGENQPINILSLAFRPTRHIFDSRPGKPPAYGVLLEGFLLMTRSLRRVLAFAVGSFTVMAAGPAFALVPVAAQTDNGTPRPLKHTMSP